MGDASDVTIPVSDLSPLYVPEGIGAPIAGIVIGCGPEAEVLEIVRRNPPSKKHPKGSITVRRNTDTGPVVATIELREKP